MGGPNIPTPKAPAPADTTKAMIAALNFNETNKKLRRSQGRQSTFLTGGTTPLMGGQQRPMNTALGM